MDSARDFNLLGESVPQVRVSARTLALLGFSLFYLFRLLYFQYDKMIRFDVEETHTEL